MAAKPDLRFDALSNAEGGGSVIPMPPVVNHGEVYRRYSDMVYRLALARCRNVSDAEDVLQDVFVRYVRANPSFDSAAHQKAGLIRATINCSNTLLTSAWRRHTTALEGAALNIADGDEPDASAEIYSAVLRLPANLRTVIHLYYYEGYRVTEIAELTGAKVSTVKSRLLRARERLEKDLKGDLFDV